VKLIEFDIGNTRCKWRVLNPGGLVVEFGSFDCESGLGSQPIFSGIGRARLASVAKSEIVQPVIEMLRRNGIEPEFATSTVSAAGVVNAYVTEPGSLGVDRWLAVVAAYNKEERAVLVLDVGSALTADLVASGGVHLGGYITPGTRLMKASLQQETGKVRFDTSDHHASLDFGCSTVEAVKAGVLAAQLGAAKVAIEQARRKIPAGFAILLTGGGAGQLVGHLGSGVEVVPDLVMDGLIWLLP
jgi:type III pantothenate kinase